VTSLSTVGCFDEEVLLFFVGKKVGVWLGFWDVTKVGENDGIRVGLADIIRVGELDGKLDFLLGSWDGA